MKLLKSKVLIIGIGVLLIAGSLLGQEEHQKRRGERPERMKVDHFSEKMSEELKLTDEQEAEIKEIMKTARKDRSAQKVIEKSKVDSEILEVLNTEQQATFKAMKVEREKRLTKRMEGQASIKEFREKNIAPFILQKRVELESLLTDEEKASLEKIRNSKSDSNIKGNRNRKGKSAKRQRLSKEDRTLLKEISEKYAEDIDRLQGEIEENQETWNKEIQSIKEAYQWDEEGMKEKGANRNAKREERKGKKGGKGNKKGGKDMRFLLMGIEN